MELKQEIVQVQKTDFDLLDQCPSLRMRAVVDLVNRAPYAESVLVEGETGTGKEVVARAIHHQSKRVGKFVALNCGAIPEHLAESEFFGHEKGAFTGAREQRIGKCERAHGGTLLLDEIEVMPQDLQAKLLRVLDRHPYERLGGTKPIQPDLLVVAATNCSSEKMVREGRMREDLFHRLNVLTILVPPLRERREDIPFLARYFARSLRVPVDVHESALQALQDREWRGNVRELLNAIKRARLMMNLEETVILPKHLERVTPKESRTSDSREAALGELFGGMSLDVAVESLERVLIARTLSQHSGRISPAADALRMDRSTLRKKLERWKRAGRPLL